MKFGRGAWIMSGLSVIFILGLGWIFSISAFVDKTGFFDRLPGSLSAIILLGPTVLLTVLYFGKRLFTTNFGYWKIKRGSTERCGPCGSESSKGRIFDSSVFGIEKAFICERCMIKHAKGGRVILGLVALFLIFFFITAGISFFDPSLGYSSTSASTRGTVIVRSPALESIAGSAIAYFAGIVLILLAIVILVGTVKLLIKPISREEINRAGSDIIRCKERAIRGTY